MPTYVFECYAEEGGCGHVFERTAEMSKSTNLKPTCSSCNKKKPVGRNYQRENIRVVDATPQTVGALADRNTNRMSDDEKHSRRDTYIEQPFTGQLPEGASLIPTDAKGKRQASKKQRKRDPKRGKRKE